MALINIWHLRKVAEASAKPCDICYKSTASVLITPDNQDYFYVCQGHMKDRGFCSPIINEVEVTAQKKKAEMDHEIEKIKKEYEEKIKKRISKDKDDNKDKENGIDDKKEKEDRLKTDHNEHTAEKEKNDKIAAITAQAVAPNFDEMPRIYELHKVFYQKRLDRKRNAEMAKRDRERLNALKNPTLFPSVPRNSLG